MAWQKNGTPLTLTGISDNLEITDLVDLKFNQVMFHAFPSGRATNQYRISGISTNTYAFRNSNNGATDELVNTVDGDVLTSGIGPVDATPIFGICYMIGVSGEEKLGITFAIYQNTTGAANAPSRTEHVWKNTDTNLISEVACINTAAGVDWNTDSNISCLGTD